MTKGELIELLEPIPDDALIYIESEHGQTPEQAGYIGFARCSEHPYYGDEIQWSTDRLMAEVATGILIS